MTNGLAPPLQNAAGSIPHSEKVSWAAFRFGCHLEFAVVVIDPLFSSYFMFTI